MIKKESAAGKELDFIGQEIQREANTISAKAQSAQVSSSVVKIKAPLIRSGNRCRMSSKKSSLTREAGRGRPGENLCGLRALGFR